MKRVSPIALFLLAALIAAPLKTAYSGGRYERLLGRKEGRSKLAALARMEESGSVNEAVVEGLITDSEPLIRLRCAEVLGRIADTAYVDYLAGLTLDEDPEVAAAAVFSLGLTGGGAALEPLRRVIARAPGREMKMRAVEALGRTGIREAAPYLVNCLKAFSSALRAEAALALAALGDSAYAGECRNSLDDPSPRVMACAIYAIGRLGFRDAMDAAIPLLEHEDATVRMRAAEALGRMGASEAVPHLASALADSDRDVAIQAARALTRIGGKRSAEALVDLLQSKDSYLKTIALEGISEAGRKEFFECVDPLLEDPSPMVRRSALVASAATGGREARSHILKAISDGTRAERSTALELLGEIGTVDDLALLTEILSTGGDHLLREGAAEGLGKWKNQKELLLPHDVAGDRFSSLEALLEAADGEDWVISAIVIESLGRVAAPKTIIRLADIYGLHNERLDSDRRLAVISAVEALAGKGPYEQEKATAVAALLRKASMDPDPRVREAATSAAASLGLKIKASRLGSAPWRRGVQPWGEAALPLGERKILLETARGEIEILLFGDEAPNVVKSLLTLAEGGFYDGLTFHRVVPGFVIQGGCPRGDGWGDAGYFLRSQLNHHRYERGTVGMANSGKDTPGSQFFITHIPQPHLDGRYTVVGRVTRGMDVVGRIEAGDMFTIKVVE